MNTILKRFSGNLSKKRTFYQIFVYIIAISSIILLLATIILYNSFKETSIEEIKNKSIDQLKQTMVVFNSLHSLIISTSVQLNADPLVSELLYKKKLGKYSISLALDRFESYQASYPLIHSIFVYNSQMNEYYSSLHGIEGQIPSDRYLTELLKNIKKFRTYEYIPRKTDFGLRQKLQGKQILIDTQNVFTIIAGTAPLSGENMKSTLVINISEQKLRNTYLASESTLGGDLVIIDKKGTILSHPDKDYFGKSRSDFGYINDILKEKNEHGIFISRINGTRYLISYLTNPQMEWIFINVNPYDKLFEKVDNLRNLSILVFLLLITFAVVLSLLSSRQIYFPIQNLFVFAQNISQKINHNPEAGVVGPINEFQSLNDVFSSLSRKVDKLDVYFELHKRKYSSGLLNDIIHGNILPSEIEDEYFQNIKGFFSRSKMIFLLMHIDRFQILSKYLKREYLEKCYTTILKSIEQDNSLQSMATVMDQGSIAVFVRDDHVDEKFLKRLRRIQDKIRRNTDFSVSIAVSRQFDNENSILQTCRETVNLITQSFKEQPGEILLYDAGLTHHKKEYVYPENKVRQLFNELKLGKAEKSVVILKEIFDDIKNYNFDDFRFAIRLLTYQTLKIIGKMEGDFNFDLRESRKLLDGIDSIEKIIDANDIFVNVFDQIVKVISCGRQNSKRELIESIKKHVESGIADPGLCPGSIAGTFGFTTQHIRNLFKENTGISLSDYINNLRIEQCKKLLQNTKLSVKDVAVKSGFINYNYFFTAFKKNTGVTPELFRRKRNRGRL